MPPPGESRKSHQRSLGTPQLSVNEMKKIACHKNFLSLDGMFYQAILLSKPCPYMYLALRLSLICFLRNFLNGEALNSEAQVSKISSSQKQPYFYKERNCKPPGRGRK
ncbi:hypothetical protein TNCV_2025211 [Trichonephila clavipes]|nr:hypothetical protein TNCV_2025211 [Trichonephila clavipes]